VVGGDKGVQPKKIHKRKTVLEDKRFKKAKGEGEKGIGKKVWKGDQRENN